jgi:hypothetical protein
VYGATTPGYLSSPLLLGAFAILLGIGAMAAALRRRRDRARYPETYAATGGVVYTGVQMGCGAVLLLGGVGLVALSLLIRS